MSDTQHTHEVDPVQNLFDESMAMMNERDEFGIRRHTPDQVADHLHEGLEAIESRESFQGKEAQK